MEGDPSRLSAKCPLCRTELWARRAGEWTLRNAILKVVEGEVVARCPTARCSGDVPVPWMSVTFPSRGRRYIVRSRLTDRGGTGEGAGTAS